MVDTPNLGITHVEELGDGKEVVVDDGLDELDIAMNDLHDENLTAGGTITIATADFQQHHVFRMTGTPGAGVTVDIPDDSDGRNRFFGFWNACGQTVTLDTVTGISSTATIAFLDNETANVLMFGRELKVIGTKAT